MSSLELLRKAVDNHRRATSKVNRVFLLDPKLEDYVKDPNNTNMEEAKKAPQYEKQFNAAVAKIDKAKMYHLPDDTPWKVTIPIEDCLNRTYENENQNTPFDESEVRGMQYMTMVNSGLNRGIMHVLGMDDPLDLLSPYRSSTPSIASGTATPRSERDPNKPRVKMSFADYKAGKRPTSSSSKAIGMSGQTSGAKPQNGVNVGCRDVPPAADTQKIIDQIIAQSGTASTAPTKPTRPSESYSTQTSTPYVQPKVELQKSKAVIVKDIDTNTSSSKNGQSTPAAAKSKRNLDDAELATPPEKRMKIGGTTPTPHLESASKKSALKNLPYPPGQSPAAIIHDRSPKPNIVKNSVQKPSIPSKLSSSQEAKNALPAKLKDRAPPKTSVQTDTRKARAIDSMPPLLSPLPAGLTSPDGHVETSKKQEITPPKSPKSKIVEKSSSGNKHNIDSPPSSPAAMPPLLSPTLPSWIERELIRLKEQSAPAARASPLPTAAMHGVEARHERSRKPDTPGVARKTVKAKNSATANGAAKADESIPEKRALIIKLKYGKRNAKNIKDLLRLPSRALKGLNPTPSTVTSSSTTAATSDDKKRTRPAEERQDPPAKRAKPLSGIDVQKSQTPVPQSFKSPALSTPSASQRANPAFGTPKKGDAMKSVNMRKVNSSDGQARTPQAAISTPVASTPASIEKPKASGTSPVLPPTEKDKAREAEAKALFAVNQKYDSLGKTLKREGDVLLKSGKEHPKPPPPVNESDRKLGTVTHLESITSYMLSFQALDSNRALKRARNDGFHWSQMADGLIAFIERFANPYPELHALLCLLGMICREQCQRHQMELLNDFSVPIESAMRNAMRVNSKARSFLLAQYAKHHAVHNKVHLITTVDEARKLTVEVLERFVKDNNIKWACRLDSKECK